MDLLHLAEKRIRVEFYCPYLNKHNINKHVKVTNTFAVTLQYVIVV